MAETYGVSVQLYANDTQFYVSFDMNYADDLAAAKSRLEKCTALIDAWMKENTLKLTKDKMELIVICHSRQCHKLQDVTVKVGDTEIVLTTSVRNFNVMFNENISMVDQVTHCNCHMQSHQFPPQKHWYDREVSHQEICRDCHPCISHILPRQ